EGNELSDLSALFDVVEENRHIISARLSPTGTPHEEEGPEWYEGFGSKQQEVLIPAFLSAYTDQDPQTISLDIFNQTPRPNWTINYNGLSKIGGLDEIFRDFSLRHSYQSTLT